MKVSVRRSLLRLAESGNASAAIFSAKVLLGFIEPERKQHVEFGGDVSVRFIASWAGHGRTLPAPADEVETIEAEAEEETPEPSQISTRAAGKSPPTG